MSSVVSEASSVLSDLNEDNKEGNTMTKKTRIAPGGRRGHDAFGSMIDDWLGDDCSFLSNEDNTSTSTHNSSAPATDDHELLLKKKKKIVPIRHHGNHGQDTEAEAPTTEATSQTTVCYLLLDTQTQATLIEQYSKTYPPSNTAVDPSSILASYSIPSNKSLPSYKYTRNFGKSTLVNATMGDLRVTNIDKWVAEGSKLGFASKLDISAGCAYPNTANSSEIKDRLVGDAARPSGGKSYSSLSRQYDVIKLHNEQASSEKERMRREERLKMEDKEIKAVRSASEKGSREYRDLEERELMKRFEMEKNSSVGASDKISSHSNTNSSNTNTNDSDPSQRTESKMTEGTPVYIRDAHYSYLPAIISSPQDDKHRLKVQITLPSDWNQYTVLPPKSSTIAAEERIVKLTDYPNNELPLQNITKNGDDSGKNDMADMEHLHEAAILYNLKRRHVNGNPYTRVGDIMVALNPFQWIDGLYSEEKQMFYAKCLIWQAPISKATPQSYKENKDQSLATAATERQALGYEYEKLGIHPHVYETSSLAYLGLAHEGNNQAILVTGESGAGKTETIKIVMNHLATVERSRPLWPESDRSNNNEQGSEQVVNRVLHSNPLFESFGNAKTLRNDNSSRFGKFTQLLFDVESAEEAARGGRSVPSCHLVGSKCITYLLEKSRVVKVSDGERTYHIFYQLIGAPDEAKESIWREGLVGAETSDFGYLSSSAGSIDGLASGENWNETVESLGIFGIDGVLFLDLTRSLCVILQLGNITFGSEFVDGEERSHISSTEALQKLSALLGVSEGDIETSMIKRFMVTRSEEFTISLKANEAKDGCDALAKEIYARVFDYLVHKINEYTEPSDGEEYGTISLLDIFGFESFAVNRFEQLCINYANERLQQKYVNDNFQSVKSEYEGEGINVFDFSLIDNSDVIELLEGRLGLISQLNEECVRPNGGDESFVYKLKVVNSDSSRLLQDKLHYPYEFAVHHYAAPIKYDARQFIERNLDKIPTDLLSCARKSTNPFIRDQFNQLLMKTEGSKNTSVHKKRSEATKDLVTSKFKGQLTSLMTLIEKSRTRCIRCVKPNKTMIPRVLDHSHTVSQLESAGLVTAIVISRESFPNRLSYEQVMERYKFLCYKYSDMKLRSGDVKVDSETLLSHLLEGITVNTHKGRVKPFACGKTKIYFRIGALERIESIRQEYYAERAVQLQTWTRSLQARKKYTISKRGVILLQCEVRRWRACKEYRKTLRSAIILQCFARKTVATLERKRRQREHKTVIIQARWRVKKPQQQFKTSRVAAIKIQSLARMKACISMYNAKKKEKEEEHAIAYRMSMIQQNFDDASTVQGTVFSVDEGLLEEVETMFEFLRKEIVALRKKNSALKKQLTESEAYKREIYNHASSVDHSYALAKIRIEQMTKTNATLLEDNNRRRKDASKLKSELKLQQESHGEQLKQMRADFDIALAHREMELKDLRTSWHSTVALHRREVQMIQEEAERKREENSTEINRLRDEIKRTQESHQDYLAKLMDVLETTQQSRQVDGASMDIGMLRKKDEEIARLKEELAALRANSSSNANEVNEQQKQDAVKSMVYSVKKNRQHRKSHVTQMQTLASQLENSIASGDHAQMSSLVESLKNAIQAGEKANSKMDREMVNMIDFSSAYFNPQVAGSGANIDELVAENQRLRQKLEKRYHCKKCGYKRGC
ncbi:hypothetical protein ACHAXN_005483 [Cyclotella atomus]